MKIDAESNEEAVEANGQQLSERKPELATDKSETESTDLCLAAHSSIQ